MTDKVRQTIATLDNARPEGFWSPDHPPVPLGEPWGDKDTFLVALTAIEAAAERVRYRGWSTCRLCLKPNGSITYLANGWKWPEGYAHYIRDHNVRPSADFAAMVTARP
jgi:hypothetical protein